MSHPALTSGSITPTRVEQRGVPVAAHRAAFIALVACAIAGGTGTLAAQSAPQPVNAPRATAPSARVTLEQRATLDDTSAHDVARGIEELAPLEEALRDVHGLTQPQSDSLAALEQRYAKVFAALAGSARTMIDDARAQGVAPNVAELRSLCETVWSVRRAELVSARAMLTTRAQRTRFDSNVAKVQCEEARLVEDVWLRSAGSLDGSART